MSTKRKPYIRITDKRDGFSRSWWWAFVAANGEIIAWSERYKSKRAVLRAVELVNGRRVEVRFKVMEE